MKVLEGGGQLGPSSVSPCQSFNDTYCSLGGCPLPGLGWGQAAWCPWACRGCWGAVHRCSIGEKSGGSRWPDIYPVSKTRFPAGERPDFRPARDPSPATTPGTPAKLPGVLGHVPRCVAVIEDLFSGQGRPVSGRRRPVSSHRLGGACQAAGRAGAVSPRRGLASFCRARAEGRQAHRAPHRGWRPGRCVRSQAGGPADAQDVERHGRGSRAGMSLAWARH